jgi:lipopolysaccharide heptosyltransferase II
MGREECTDNLTASEEGARAREALPPPSLALRLVAKILVGVNRLEGRRADSSATPRKILVVRRGYVGDVIQTTALVGDLRRAWPEAEIVYMTGAGGAQVLAGNPNLDRIIPSVEMPGRGSGGWGGLWTALRRLRGLRRERFDLGLCLSHNSRESLLLRLAGVGRAAGPAEPQREFLLDLAVTWDERELRAGHEHHAALLRALGIEPVYRHYDFPAGEGGEGVRTRLLPEWDPGERPLLVLAPGGGRHPAGAAPYRQWPAERFAAVASILAGDEAAEIALIGDEQDTEVAQRVVAALPEELRSRVHDLTRRTSLVEMGALLREAGLLIANDSAPVWVAAAVGCPVVAIFGCNHPVNHRPLVAAYAAVHGEVPCHPCFSGARAPDCHWAARCLKQIEPERVAAVAREVIAAERARKQTGEEEVKLR